MADYAALKQKQRALIRKGLEGSTFVASQSAPSLTAATLFGADGSFANATGSPILQYKDMGHVSTDGAQYATDINTSNVNSWGAVSPTRTDVTTKTTTLQVVAQETKALTLAIYTGYSVADIVPDANGLLTIKEPARPTTIYYRTLTVSVDETDDGDIYLCRHQPLANVTAVAGQNLNNADDPTAWGVTFTGELDDAYGSAQAWLFGGAGWLAQLEAMGFDPVG